MSHKTDFSDTDMALLVKQYPCIYDTGNRHYLKKQETEYAWETIALFCRTTAAYCKLRWRKIRDAYTKRLLDMQSGRRPNSEKRSKMLKVLGFLQPFEIVGINATKPQNASNSKRHQIEPLPTTAANESTTTSAADNDFLNSLKPQMAGMNTLQKLHFKQKILQSLLEAYDEVEAEPFADGAINQLNSTVMLEKTPTKLLTTKVLPAATNVVADDTPTNLAKRFKRNISETSDFLHAVDLTQRQVNVSVRTIRGEKKVIILPGHRNAVSAAASTTSVALNDAHFIMPTSLSRISGNRIITIREGQHRYKDRLTG